jgi:hypothetical protein
LVIKSKKNADWGIIYFRDIGHGCCELLILFKNKFKILHVSEYTHELSIAINRYPCFLNTLRTVVNSS